MIQVQIVDHQDQRYPTAGDWFPAANNTHLRIVISKTRDPRSTLALAVHEFVEALLCEIRGVSAEVVDQWDLSWKGPGEPGDHPDAPYHREHLVATACEKLFVEELDLPWDEHDANVTALD